MAVICSVTTVVFSGVVRPSSFYSGAGGAVSALLLDDVVRVVTGFSTFIEGKDSAPESIPVVTLSVVELLLEMEPAGVPSSTDRVPSIVVGGSLSGDVDAVGLKMEWLSDASSSPEPVDVCTETTATVTKDGVTAAAGPVDVAVQTECE